MHACICVRVRFGRFAGARPVRRHGPTALSMPLPVHGPWDSPTNTIPKPAMHAVLSAPTPSSHGLSCLSACVLTVFASRVMSARPLGGRGWGLAAGFASSQRPHSSSCQVAEPRTFFSTASSAADSFVGNATLYVTQRSPNPPCRRRARAWTARATPPAQSSGKQRRSTDPQFGHRIEHPPPIPLCLLPPPPSLFSTRQDRSRSPGPEQRDQNRRTPSTHAPFRGRACLRP